MASFGRLASVYGEPEAIPVATIRAHDCVHIPTDSMSRGTLQLVTNIYGAIGVQTRWFDTLRPAESSFKTYAPISCSKELLVLVLSPSISRRLMIANDLVGVAVIGSGNRGNVA